MYCKKGKDRELSGKHHFWTSTHLTYECPISHTKYPSRTRLPHLAHDYPFSHTKCPNSCANRCDKDDFGHKKALKFHLFRAGSSSYRVREG